MLLNKNYMVNLENIRKYFFLFSAIVGANSANMQGNLSAGQKRARDERGGPATKKAHVSDTEGNFVNFPDTLKIFQ